MPPTPFFRTTNTATLRWGRHVLVYASNCIQTYPHPLHCAVPWFMFLIAATALPPFLRAADPLWLGPCVLGSSVLGGAKRGCCNKCSSAPSCFMHPVSAPPQTFGVIEILERGYFVIWQLRMTLESIRNSCDVLHITCFVHPVLPLCICLWRSLVAPFAHLKICKHFLSNSRNHKLLFDYNQMIWQIFKKHSKNFILI